MPKIIAQSLDDSTHAYGIYYDMLYAYIFGIYTLYITVNEWSKKNKANEVYHIYVDILLGGQQFWQRSDDIRTHIIFTENISHSLSIMGIQFNVCYM